MSLARELASSISATAVTATNAKEWRGPAGTGTATAGVLKLTTAELDVVDADQLGRIDFLAPLEASGTDAILVGASIYAEADDTFAADNNETELVFATGASEAAAEKMRIDSAGFVGIGTSAPASIFHLSGANAKLTIQADSTDPAYLQFLPDNGANTSEWLITAHKDSPYTLHFGRTSSDTKVMSMLGTNGNIGIGTVTPVTKVTIDGTLTLKEQADADSDTAAYGQIWVNTATPCELYFTDDAGTDYDISGKATTGKAIAMAIVFGG